MEAVAYVFYLWGDAYWGNFYSSGHDLRNIYFHISLYPGGLKAKGVGLGIYFTAR